MSERPIYYRLAEAHWREHCPRRVAELERTGVLEAALQEASDLTATEMGAAIRSCLQRGATPDQAEREAWEMIRERHVLLPPETPA
ncbi:MAG: hypothetical protein JWM32_1600 [Verrucomicrobia bacterium]|nr:hypothetical protein [Verrucomicrobiota bacterium]